MAMLIAMLVILYIPVFCFVVFTPYLTRRTEQFGVGIPEEAYNDPEVRRIREQYRNRALLFGGIIVLLFPAGVLFLFRPEQVAGGSPFGVILLLLLSYYLYLSGHRAMKALKAERGWATDRPQQVLVDTDFRKGRITVSPWWFGLYFVIIGITIGIGLAAYDRMPTRVPIHFNLMGEPNGWANKSLKLIFFGPLMQLLMTGLMIFVYRIIGQARQEINPADPEKSLAQNRIFRRRWSAFIVATGLGLLLVFGWMQLSFSGWIGRELMALVPLGITGLIVVGAMVLSVTTGQGGSRVRTASGKTGNVINRDEDRYWKLGIFYYNPDDPALFVEKRFGIGWTNNFARPMSWVMMGLLLLVILAVIGLSNYLVK